MAFWNKKQNQNERERVAVKLTAPAEYVQALVDLVSAVSGVDYMVVDETEIVLQTDKERLDTWLGKARRFTRFA